MSRGFGLWALLALWLLPWQGAVAAAPSLRLSAATPRVSLDGRLEHFADPGNRLSLDEVRRQAFVQLAGSRSLGYDTGAHWFRATLEPAADAPARWVLAIGTPELEEVDVWMAQRDGGFRHYAMGYHRPYANRPLQTRLFTVPVDVFPGAQIYLRVHTTNAINVHASLWQVGAFTAHETRSNFYRGVYFGVLLIAVLLYAILGARLRDAVMASYAGYIASQLLFNLGTNGYLPVLFTAHAGWFTDALPRVGWLGGAAAIVWMWDRLLDLGQTHPNVHRLYLFTVLLNLALLPFALIPSLVAAWLLHVVTLANVLNSLNQFISLALVLEAWRRRRRDELLVYFAAFVIPALGALVNTTANLGLLSQNAVTSNFYQLAPLAHVLVMSYGLALRLRQLQRDKLAAEQDAVLATRRSDEQRRFVAMLSHEFGNPLAAIDRAAQMLQIKPAGLPDDAGQRLAHIRNHAATLAGFVDNFLMTEALDHGALSMQRESCGVAELLEATAQRQNEALRHRIRLQPPPAGTRFWFDPGLLGMAVGNLLANALNYSPKDSPVELGAHVDGRGLHIRVADHGPGLDAAELASLGTPYFRASSSLGKKGSGLGYHFTRRIVEAHGGQLSAQTREGLEVRIFLPG